MGRAKKTRIRKKCGEELFRKKFFPAPFFKNFYRKVFESLTDRLQNDLRKFFRKRCGKTSFFQKRVFPLSFCFIVSFACKPGSVVEDGHQSLRPVAGNAPSRRSNSCHPDHVPDERSWGVASDRVYSGPMLPWELVSSYLAFPSLPLARRFLSVALSRRLPVADVISYPVL